MEIEQVDPELYRFYNCLEHPDEAMNRVCVDEHCEDCTLVCPLCMDKYHPGHKTQTIKAVMKRMKNQLYLQDPESSIETFKEQISRQTKTCTASIEASRNLMNDMFNEMKAKICTKFDKLIKHVQTEHEEYMSLSLRTAKEFKYDGNWKRSELVNQFKTSFKAFKENEGSLRKLQSQIEARLNYVSANMNELLGKLKNELECKFDQIANTLELRDQEEEIFSWSPQGRHSDVTIKGKTVERSALWKSASVCAVMDKAVSTMPPSVHEWQVKIVKLFGLIDVGICQQSKVEKNSYTMSIQRESTGSGNFMLRSNGEIVNSGDKILNSIGKCFDFSVGDTISIRYDVCYGNIYFKKNKNEARIDMKVPPPPVGDFYWPCVYLNKVGDSVEIVDKKVGR